VDVQSPAAVQVLALVGRVRAAVGLELEPGVLATTVEARALERVAPARAVVVRVLEQAVPVRVVRVPAAVEAVPAVPAVVLVVRRVVRVGLPVDGRAVRADGPVGRVRAAARRTGMKALRRTGVGMSGPVATTRVSGIRSVAS
jgi:hypothetical protein